MIKNAPPAIGGQLDRCDVCGDKYQRSDLVRTQVEFLDMKAENYLLYSSYDSSYWTVDDASDVTSTTVGTYGNRCDNVRLSLDLSNNLTYLNSPKVWEGNGTMRMTTLSGNSSDTSTLVFSAVVGPHEQNTSPEMTVALGVTNSAGTVKQAVKTWTISGVTRVYFAENSLTLENYGLGSGNQQYFYIQVTNAGKWWIDEMQFEINPTNSVPENFVRTSGAIVSNQSERGLVTSRKVCPNCAETVLRKSERFGRTDEKPVADPVDVWTQEF